MKDNTIRTFANWRAAALVLIGASAVICLSADAENSTKFWCIKLAGFALSLSAYFLFRHWDRRGLMDDLKRIAEE